MAEAEGGGKGTGRNYFVLDGVDSRTFGVYISGQGTFSSPARPYEARPIPGRYGDILTGGKRLENGVLTYPAFIVRDLESNIRALRNFLLSRSGYVRLTDSYHPEEFRMAAFVEAIKPEMEPYNESGRFSLEFVCKPQRFLLAGNIPVKYYPVTCGSIDEETGESTEDASMCRLEHAEVIPGTDFQVEIAYSEDDGQQAIVAVYDPAMELIYIETVPVEDGTISYSIEVPAPSGYIAQVAWTRGASGITITNDGVSTSYSDDGLIINNPTLFASKPLITVGNGEGEKFTVNETKISVSEYRNATQCMKLSVDCDVQDCYLGSVNLNPYVSFTTLSGGIAYEYPKFNPGKNEIITSTYPTAAAAESAIEYLEITPRWWRT